jgi:hypothetical protein
MDLARRQQRDFTSWPEEKVKDKRRRAEALLGLARASEEDFAGAPDVVSSL